MRVLNKRLLALVALVAMLTMAAVAGGAKPKPKGPVLAQFNFSGASFTIGSKQFTEQRILGAIAKIALESTKARVNDQIGLGGTVAVRSALTSGNIDMYWEYTGTGWLVHLKKDPGAEAMPKSSAAMYRAVAREDLTKNGVRWLAPAPFDNTYAFAVRKEAVSKLKVKKISDFKKLIQTNKNAASLCVNTEFSTRPDGLPGVEAHYGIKFPRDKLALVDQAIIYQAIDKGEICNFGEVFATDGRIAGLGLVVLEDDKKFFPIYNAAMTVRNSVYTRYPKLGKMFQLIAKKLTPQAIRKLNADVDMQGKFPEEVARAWLKQNKFIR